MTPINFIDQNDFLLEAPLEGVTYFLHLSWNSEAELWVLGIQNANNEAILQGVALVPNVALLANFHTLGTLPPGEFVVASQDPNVILRRDSFLTGQAALWYLTEDEYGAL